MLFYSMRKSLKSKVNKLFSTNVYIPKIKFWMFPGEKVKVLKVSLKT